jgi:glutamine synthetase
MAIYAPNFNSYRRFQPGSYAPMAPTWGYENRTVALRIPSDDFAATRIEHRVSGADANPYLVLASILAGAYEGLTRKLQPTAAMEGDAYAQAQSSLPVYWPDALNAFERSSFVRTHLGEVFQRSYLAAKRQELNEFRHTVTRMEYDAYLLAF